MISLHLHRLIFITTFLSVLVLSVDRSKHFTHACAFVVQHSAISRPQRIAKSFSAPHSKFRTETGLCSTTDSSSGKNGDSGESYSIDSMPSDAPHLDAEIREVREEIVKKYLQIGRTLQEAEAEVDEFLSDPDRSEKYLEMRRYAKAQTEVLGKDVMTIGAAFVLGLVGTVGAKYFAAVKEVFPDAGV